VFLIFNVQNNELFSYQKNEIDHGFKGIDKGQNSVCKRYLLDNESILKGLIDWKWLLIGVIWVVVG